MFEVSRTCSEPYPSDQSVIANTVMVSCIIADGRNNLPAQLEEKIDRLFLKPQIGGFVKIKRGSIINLIDPLRTVYGVVFTPIVPTYFFPMINNSTLPGTRDGLG